MATYSSPSGARAILQFTFDGTGASSMETNLPVASTTTPDPTPTPAPTDTTESITSPDTGFFTGSSSLDSSDFFIFGVVFAAALLISALVLRSRPRARHSYLPLSSGLKIRDLRTSLKDLGIFTSIFLGVFLLASVLAPNLLSEERKEASAISGTALSISRSSNSSETRAASVNFDTDDSPYVILTDDISVSASGASYNLYLSTNDDSETGNYLKRTGSTTDAIAPTTGTVAARSVLAVNQWGFTAITPSQTARTDVSNSSAVWAAVPAYSDTNLVAVPPAAIVNNATKIVYGAHGSKTGTVAGTYTTTILYTAIAIQ